MKEKHSFNFAVGLLIGGLVGLLFWYWQKSTSAEDGALALLDKLAATEKRVRQLRAELASGEAVPEALRNISLPTIAAEVPSFLARARDELLPSEPQESGEESGQDDLTQVKGIGAVFNGRLHEAGITTFARLKKASAEELAEILQIRPGRAESIIAEAQQHS